MAMVAVKADDIAVGEATLGVVRGIATQAVAEVSKLLPGLSGDVALAVIPDGRVIPETGEVGASVSPGLIEWHVDPSRPEGITGVAERELRFTLFHELHHQVRGWVMQGGEWPTTFMEGPVCEGLASAFERDAAGRRAPWAEYPPEVENWVNELLALPLRSSYREWMFQHPDGRRWIGYRAGTYIADRAIKRSGLSAAQLVTTPTAKVLQLGGYTMPDRAR